MLFGIISNNSTEMSFTVVCIQFFINFPIYRWDCESGEITLFTDQSGRSNGMYFDAKGNLIACADMDNQLWSFDIEGHSKILITDYRGKLMNGPNDVWISGKYVKDHFGMTPLDFRNN